MASPASNASRSAETGAPASGSATGSPGTSPASTPRPAVDVTALTTRDDFLLELGEALGGQASVRPVDSVGGAIESLSNTKRGQILVVDTRDVLDVRADVELVHAQAPHAVVLVFAAAEAEKQVSAAVKGSNAVAVLTIPIDKRKASAVLEGALADAVAKRATARTSAASPGLTVESFQAPSAEPVATEIEPAAKSKVPLLAGAAVVVVAVAAGAFWFLSKGKETPSGPTVASNPAALAGAASQPARNISGGDDAGPAVDVSIVKGKVDDLLESARKAMRERRYSEPTGDNALLFYRSASAADPTNGEAKDGLQRVAGVLSSRFDEAMNGGRFDEAALALANFKLASPNDPRTAANELRLMTAQVSKAVAEGNMDRATALVRQAAQSPNIPADQITKWRADITRRQDDAKVQRLVGLISDRTRDGNLTDPQGDSAKTYVQQLRELAPNIAATARAVRELNTAYLRKAREAAMAKNAADEQHWIDEARNGGVGANEIASFQRELTTARQKAAQAESDKLLQSARDRTRDGRLTDPAQDSAAFYLGQVKSSDPTNAQLPQASRDLAARLIDRAKASASAGKVAQADADVTVARQWGATAADAQVVQQIESAQRSAATGGAPRPAGSTPASAPATSPTSLAAGLKRLRYTPPEYPAKALSQRMSGSVTVEFTVDTNGDPRDVHVVEATPPGVFDRAAISAVKRWHYEPMTSDGAPVEVPVRTSIRFELPK